MKKIIVLFGICFFWALQTPFAQVNKVVINKKTGLNQFLQLVSDNNLEYAAEKFNVPISQAAIEQARIFPDPTFAFNWLENREEKVRSGTGFVSELGTTIELGGKRKARIDLAKSETKLTQALLDDYFRNLRAEAAFFYFEALKQQQLLEVKKSSFQTMNKLAEADSIRLSLGSIMKTDAIQSKLEAGILLNELLQSETEQQNSLYQLNLMAGLMNSDTLLSPENSKEEVLRQFNLNDLIEIAEQNRADLEAARYNREVSEKATTLTKKERRMDLDVMLGLENDLEVPNTGSGAKIFSLGIGIPLKFSNMYKGDLKMAELYEQQVEKQYHFVLLKIKTEIIEAFQNYISAKNQVDNFKNNLLKQSNEVLKGKIYSYQRGETSLLEVLNAQRTFNGIQFAYIEIVNKNYVALVELERATGIWDINM